ncbi:MAG: 16S rRNA (adenine(1518)-N(6)/adenine(1519)-N(6))-dimethyltransferase RsmA [Candidatus Saccharimonadales bacterium]
MPNKSLGQHWLKDRLILEAIVDSAGVTPQDHVVEIGPGLGTMTSVILGQAKSVTAVEYDETLASKLLGQFPGKQLEVVNTDILQYDFSAIVGGYKVIGNIPYYITNKIVRSLTETSQKPSVAVLLMQKEVADRIAAEPGAMSILSVITQVYYEATLGIYVPREYFTPPPKVDSQVIVLKLRNSPLVTSDDQKQFFRVVKAGFVARRKKLRSSLAGGLNISKQTCEHLLEQAGVSQDARAQELSVEQWLAISHSSQELSI